MCVPEAKQGKPAAPLVGRLGGKGALFLASAPALLRAPARPP